MGVLHTMITIRQCTKKDLPPCGAFLRQIYAEPPYCENWSEERATAYLESFFHIDPQGALVAVEGDNEIVGAVFGYSYPWQTGSMLFLQELFVTIYYRRRGIAGDLVRQLVEKKGTNSHVALIVREGTVAARFYEKLGLSKSQFYELRSGRLNRPDFRGGHLV